MKLRLALLLGLLAVHTAVSGQASQVFERAAPSVFSIGVLAGQNEQRTGSGVAVGPGKIVTNFHVVKGAREILIKQGSQSRKALLLSVDEAHDLALLHMDGLHPPVVRFGSGLKASVGQSVYAIGSPRGLELSLSAGIVSSLRQFQGGTLIQTTAPISPGSSGGGLFDEHARLIGLTTMQRADGQNLNFAVPVEWLRYVGITPEVAEIESPAPATSAPEPMSAAMPAVTPETLAADAQPAARPAPPRKTPAPRTELESDSGVGPYLGIAVVLVLLLGAKPAINGLSDWMSRDAVPSGGAAQTVRAAVPDKLRPFRAQAREELKTQQRDADSWLRALEQTAGEESRAIAAYIELRAQGLYRADLDRKWAAAQAQNQGGVAPTRKA